MSTSHYGGYYAGRRVLVTGHNGFVGSWLTRLLHAVGADVTGYGRTAHARHVPMPPGTNAELGDVTDADRLLAVIRSIRPEVIVHLAAQPLVAAAVASPAASLYANVVGSLHVLEGALRTPSVRSVVLMGTPGEPSAAVTDALDPYTASKVAATAVAAAYAHGPTQSAAGRISMPLQVTVVRPGVVLGGDRTPGRLLPDVMRSVDDNRPVVLHRPGTQRPWQHVLDVAAAVLQQARPNDRSGLLVHDLRPASATADVRWVVRTFLRAWGTPDWPVRSSDPHAEPAAVPSRPGGPLTGAGQVWALESALSAAADWYRSVRERESSAATAADAQITQFLREGTHLDTPWAAVVLPTQEGS